jgi:anti-anti-sigma regulatory factor
MFRIQRITNGELVLTLAGQISEENLPDLKSVITAEPKTTRIVLDLKDLTLVNQEAVEYLGQCENNDVKLRNCPTYIRDWIDLSRKQKSGRKK